MTITATETKYGRTPMTCTRHLERVAKLTDGACSRIEKPRHNSPKVTTRLWDACAFLKECVSLSGGDPCEDCVRAILGAIDMCAWAEGLSDKARAHIIGSTAMRVGSDYRVAVVPGVLRDEQVK